MGFGLVHSFTDHLQVVTTNNYYTIADLLIPNHSTLSLLSLLSLVSTMAVHLQSFLVRNLRDGDSSASAVRWLPLHSWTLNSAHLLKWTALNFQLFFAPCYTDSGRTSWKTRVTCQNTCLLARYPALGMARTTYKTLLIHFLLFRALPINGSTCHDIK
jgi:hypothetical protein